MTNSDILNKIRSALAAIPTYDFLTAAKDLLEILGYQSERTLKLSGHPEDFIQQFPAPNENTKTEQAFCENAQSVRFIFQLTSDEIASSNQQTLNFEAASFDKGNTNSFIFSAVELKKDTYARGQYAQFTREINKRLSQPSVVLFRTTSNLLTLAFVHRRPHKRDDKRNVLDRVTLIKDIRPDNPYRAHLDILEELSLSNLLTWMSDHNKPHNFDGLLVAWLNKLDTQELNRRFYRDLYNWFERAIAESTFPKNQAQAISSEEHIIRLITRLLFVWFIKEKRLIAEDLFIEPKIGGLLKNYDPDTGDSYYRTILQNLFFATLNTEIDKRRFSKQNRADHRNPSVYRYRAEIDDPDSLIKLFDQTPFINGGLFDCLDSFEGVKADGSRIDCFTDNPAQRRDYSIPNRLFFGANGLITLFENYKFTVEENTPIEQEVALDPELLGKVFENLLAAYNPETRETARKQTGSYYTPRPVVDYMVEEALIASLTKKYQPTDGDVEYWQERLRYLLDYEDAFDDANELFEEEEAEGIVRAIAEIKVLDPAVGSGAFPMGMLHKLTLALRRLDPDNERWEALQKERARAKADAAFETQNQQDRDAELLEISETFERYSGDFGRKLYLIQNSIFGVDIQPIACQIAKLRFFISLAIEQEPDKDANNFGIKPLPNLETRFVAADTLLQVSKKAQLTLRTEAVTRLEQKLNENRERHFHATTRRQKLACKHRDRELREELATELENLGFPTDAAHNIAKWDPYDQNVSAKWFDAEYMFGMTRGFDVVIGNPPYIQLQKNRGELGRLYQHTGYTTLARTGDIYQLFYEKGCQLLTPQRGLLCFITSNSWLRADYGKSTRRYFSEQQTPLQLLEMGKDIFENAIVDTNILIARSGKSNETGKAVDIDRLPDKNFPPTGHLWGTFQPQGEKPWSTLSAVEQPIMGKMETVGTPLTEWDIAINYGIKTGYNTAFIIDNDTKERLIAEDPNSADIIKPVLRGRDIKRYQAEWAKLWLIATFPSLHLDIDNYPAVKNWLENFLPKLYQTGASISNNEKQSLIQRMTSLGLNPKERDLKRCRKKTSHAWFEVQDTCSYHKDFMKEKLVWSFMSEQGRFVYDEGKLFCLNSVFMMSGRAIKYLCAILNSHLITWFVGNTALNTGMGVTYWIRSSVETIPIPQISAVKQRPFIQLVDSILAAKDADPDADTTEQEREINHLVYALYGLTEEEIAAVENV